MTQYKIKIFKQQTQECCKVVSCEKNILQDVKEEYSRVVEEVELPDGEYYSQLFRVLNEEDILVNEAHVYVLVSKNNKTKIG